MDHHLDGFDIEAELGAIDQLIALELGFIEIANERLDLLKEKRTLLSVIRKMTSET